MSDKRIYGIDLIKTIAIFFVIAVHFFLNSGYYYQQFSGISMLILTAFRWLFFTCVPLFLITTGFLRYKKTVSKKYYMSLIPIYISYLIAAVCAVYAKNSFTDSVSDGTFFNILSVLSFKNGYSWYMEMFFGLAILIPFINMAYNNLKEKSHKLLLIGILLFLTGVCSLDLKIFRGETAYYLFSDYWTMLYPFTYYLIGAYINEYKPHINKLLGIFALGIIIILEAMYTYLRCRGSMFNWELLGGYGGITVLASAVLIFLIFYDLNINNKILQRAVKEISSKTLDIYMISYTIDVVLYKMICDAMPRFSQRILYMPLAVITVFSLGFAYSKIKDYIFTAIRWLWNKIIRERNPEVDFNEAASNV